MDIKKTIDSSYTIWFGMNSIYEEWAKNQGLSSNTLMILYCINNSDVPITPKKLIEKLCLPKQTVTSVLNTMEKDGLIYREVNMNNRREKFVFLTTDGRKRTTKLLEALYQFEISAYSELTESERVQFALINEKLLRLFMNLSNSENK